jgi:hypothetical protein
MEMADKLYRYEQAVQRAKTSSQRKKERQQALKLLRDIDPLTGKPREEPAEIDVHMFDNISDDENNYMHEVYN